MFYLQDNPLIAAANMFKFIKAKGPHPSAERQKLQKELFSYRRVSSVFLFIIIFFKIITISGLLHALSLLSYQNKHCLELGALQVLQLSQYY